METKIGLNSFFPSSLKDPAFPLVKRASPQRPHDNRIYGGTDRNILPVGRLSKQRHDERNYHKSIISAPPYIPDGRWPVSGGSFARRLHKIPTAAITKYIPTCHITTL